MCSNISAHEVSSAASVGMHQLEVTIVVLLLVFKNTSFANAMHCYSQLNLSKQCTQVSRYVEASLSSCARSPGS